MGLEEKFTEVYNKNIFHGVESLSGVGSGSEQTRIIRTEIPKLIKLFNVHHFIDAPCGDLFWMRELLVSNSFEQYTGADIVKGVIEKNQREFGGEKVTFIHKNIVTDPLPSGDIVLCRDCLVHLSFADALQALMNFKDSGIKYLLTTTFLSRTENADLGTGFWRSLNMRLAPFNFPPPLAIINEGCTEANGIYSDKSLGLWELKDINKEITM